MKIISLLFNLFNFSVEREHVQKKTFTKWVNSHLCRINCKVNDLYTDLRDGKNLLKLLEILSGEQQRDISLHGITAQESDLLPQLNWQEDVLLALVNFRIAKLEPVIGRLLLD